MGKAEIIIGTTEKDIINHIKKFFKFNRDKRIYVRGYHHKIIIEAKTIKKDGCKDK